MPTSSGEERGKSSEEPKLTGGRKRNGGRQGSEPRLLTAVDEARRSLESLADDLRERVEEQPVKTLALALGAGYIVGGGLFTALTARLLYGGLRIGLRVAALPLVREELVGLIDSISDRGRGETERRQQ
jgi:hypothetical protein